MRAKVKTAWREASKLHGATAGFVSLVDRGANETPFKEIKAAKGVGAMGIKKRTDLQKSHKKLATRKKEAPAVEQKTVMAKIVFSQDHYEDEQAVRDWIEKAEWEGDDVTIEDDGDGNFVARPEGTTDASYKKLASVETNDEGVTAFVGVLEVSVKAEDGDDADDEDEADADDAADDGDDEDDGDDLADEAKSADKTEAAPVKKSARAEFIAKSKAKVVKFSGWDAFYSQKNTLSEALKAGMSWDATPPGFYDVQAAFNGVVQTILGDEAEGVNKAEALKKAAADYADILVGMDNFFDGYINAGEETVKKSVGDSAEKIAKWAEGYAQFVGGETPAVEQKAAETVKKEAPAPVVDETKIADLIAKAMAPMSDKIAEVAGTVSKMAERRPTKKSADLTDAGGGDRKTEVKSEADKTDDWIARKQRKALMGV